MMTGSKINVEQREDWQMHIHSDRPVYECPNCKQSAMQYYVQSAEFPGRQDFYYCYACGSFWDI